MEVFERSYEPELCKLRDPRGKGKRDNTTVQQADMYYYIIGNYLIPAFY